jgi:hypothetical protein
MVSPRERDSQRQASCREANESTAGALVATTEDSSATTFRCECGDRECTSAITLSLAEYELVRAHATRFAVARNHENPESERVVEENERFAAVELVTGDEAKLARRSDPRQRRRERRSSRSVRSGKPAKER